MFKTSSFFGALATLTITFAATSASAEDPKLYNWPDSTVPAAVVSEKGVIFLHKDGKPYRAYTWRTNKGDDPIAHVTDIDRNGSPDIVGVGTPTFAIGSNGDPIWFIKKGCKIGLVGDMAFDTKLEIMCSDKRRIKVITWDNQEAWEVDLGRSFKSCKLGDTNGDLKADVECNLSKSQIARLDGGGELITADAEESMIQDEPYEPYEPAGTDDMDSKQTYDFDKNGTADEYLAMEDNLFVVKSKAAPKPLSMIELGKKPLATLVKDLDGDGNMEIVVLTDKEVLVLSPDGKRKDRFTLDAKKYKRAPVADLQSVYANHFADNEAAQKSIKELEGDLAKCYASTVKKSEFAGGGQVLLMLKADRDGKIKNINKLHSEIADKSVISCAEKTLKKAKLPASVEGNNGTINVTMYFTFRDQ